LLVALVFSAAIFFFVRYSILQKYSQIELGEQSDRDQILDRMLAANLLVFGNWNLGYSKWDDTLEFAEGDQKFYFQANFSENELGSMDGAGNSYDVTPDHVFVFNGDHLVGYAGYDYDEERRITTPGKALMEAAENILAMRIQRPTFCLCAEWAPKSLPTSSTPLHMSCRGGSRGLRPT
jgi:hypothetical protein